MTEALNERHFETQPHPKGATSHGIVKKATTQTTSRVEIDSKASHSTKTLQDGFAGLIFCPARNFFHAKKARNGGESIVNTEMILDQNIGAGMLAELRSKKRCPPQNVAGTEKRQHRCLTTKKKGRSPPRRAAPLRKHERLRALGEKKRGTKYRAPTRERLRRRISRQRRPRLGFRLPEQRARFERVARHWFWRSWPGWLA